MNALNDCESVPLSLSSCSTKYSCTSTRTGSSLLEDLVKKDDSIPTVATGMDSSARLIVQMMECLGVEETGRFCSALIVELSSSTTPTKVLHTS